MIAIFITKQSNGADDYAAFCGAPPFRDKVDQYHTEPEIGERLKFRYANSGGLRLIVLNGAYSTKVEACSVPWTGESGQSSFIGFVLAPYSIVCSMGFDQSEGVYVFVHMGGMTSNDMKKRELDAEKLIGNLELLQGWKFAMLSEGVPERAKIFALDPRRLRLPESREEVAKLYGKLRNVKTRRKVKA